MILVVFFLLLSTLTIQSFAPQRNLVQKPRKQHHSRSFFDIGIIGETSHGKAPGYPRNSLALALIRRRSSAISLHMMKLPTLAASPRSRTAVLICLTSWLLGYLFGRRRRRTSTGSTIVSKGETSNQDDDDENQVPVWLNFAIGRMWGLFQTNTKRLISDTMQPILDAADKPEFVKNVVLTRYQPGKQAPLIQSVQRLPSRAMAEVQYSMRVTFASTSITTFLVQCSFGPLDFSIPVAMKNLDLDAKVWIGSTLAPYEPFCTTVEYALLSKPEIRFDLTIARILPITTLPVLRTLFVQLLTNDIPKRFVLPNVTKLDFTPEIIQKAMSRDDRNTNVAMITNTDPLDPKMLRTIYPEKWALFDAMDQDENGSLSFEEIRDGLKDWGYTANDSMQMFRRLDNDNDGEISFREFCHWQITPFISTEYTGELIVLIRQKVLDWTTKRFRFLSDPRVALTVNGVTEKTKWKSQLTISKDADEESSDSGIVLFMQSFDFKCQNPADEMLQISIEERWPRRRTIATGEIPLSNLLRRRNQKRKVKVDLLKRPGGGYVWLDLSYAEFVNFDRKEQEVISKAN